MRYLSVCWFFLFASQLVAQPSLSPRTYESLEKIQTLMGEENWTEAEENLKKLTRQTNKNDFAQALVAQTYARLWLLQDNMDKAIEYYQLALNESALPDNMQEGLILNLAQLHLQKEQYSKTVDLLLPWIKAHEKSPPLTHATLATAYYLQQKFNLVIGPLEKAVELDDKKEEWLKMLAYSHYQTNDYKSASSVMHKLILLKPLSKDYWLQQANFYQLQDDLTNTLAVLALAQQQGLLDKEQEFKHLILLKISQNNPFKAANMLLEAIVEGQIAASEDNYYLLYQAFVAARENKKAIMPLKKAATLSTDGILAMQLAQLYVDQQRWQDAVVACDLSLEKNIDKNKRGKTYLLRGYAAYEANDVDVARISWTKAASFPVVEKEAARWLTFLEMQP